MGTPIDVAVIPRDAHFRTKSGQQGAWLGGDPVEWIGESVRRRLAFLRRLGPMRMLGVTGSAPASWLS